MGTTHNCCPRSMPHMHRGPGGRGQLQTSSRELKEGECGGEEEKGEKEEEGKGEAAAAAPRPASLGAASGKESPGPSRAPRAPAPATTIPRVRVALHAGRLRNRAANADIKACFASGLMLPSVVEWLARPPPGAGGPR